MARALIIHGDADERQRLADALAPAVDQVADSPDGPDGLARLADGYDVAVVAVRLPSRSGISVLHDIRRDHPGVAVVMVGGSDPELAVIALEADADDHCAADVSDRELVLRVERAIERRALLLAATDPVGALERDGLALDPVTRSASVGGVVLDLTVKEFDLLRTFASSPNRVFSRADLLELVWRANAADHSVDTVTEHVYRLRGKLAAAGSSHGWIETVRGAGYRFTLPAPVIQPESQPDQASHLLVESSGSSPARQASNPLPPSS
ncbi:response regulator transcription factor [Acidimicrobiia bacterium EGI L10123]|uniref:response regulator transcription factor n=1 Tax=Salinilacustrithrix flava TaxID=2957203 RepID=UPI003D7C3397|nr:response regulator transcription factor [Acidimicrobiia bacterium EGI L10123]